MLAIRESLVQQLEVTVSRLQYGHKLRTWRYDEILSNNPESFCTQLREQLIPGHLLEYLPEPHTTTETPAALALQERLRSTLAQETQQDTQPTADSSASSGATAASSACTARAMTSKPMINKLISTPALATAEYLQQLTSMILALEQEHGTLSEGLLKPVAAYIIDCLPVSTSPSFVLSRAGNQGRHVYIICNHLALLEVRSCIHACRGLNNGRQATVEP